MVNSLDGPNGFDVSIKQARFTDKAFRNAILKLIRITKDKMEELTHGYDLSLFNSLIQSIGSETRLDDKVGVTLNDTLYGIPSSFLSTSEKPILLHYFSKIEGIRLWSHLDIQTYLEESDHLMELLLVAIHLTGGAPPRSTELVKIALQNSKQVRRSIRISDGMVAIVLVYNKTSSFTGSDKTIVRYVPEAVGRLVIQFLILIRPVQCAFAYKLNGVRSSNLERYFACYSGALSTPLLKASSYVTLFHITTRDVGIYYIVLSINLSLGLLNYGISSHRHFVKFLFRQEEGEEFEDKVYDSSLLATQFGHSIGQSSLYGTSNLAFKLNAINNPCLQMSLMWHKYINHTNNQ